MMSATEDRGTVGAAVVSLMAEATELEARVTEIRRALAELDEHMRAVSATLRLMSRSTAP